ncbi:MAG: hypothetical protein ACR2P1_01895 [Pseudomonadales bacterium]
MSRWQRRFLGSTSLPSDLSDFELEYYFKLSVQESAAVQTRYKSIYRIAA